MSVINTQPLIGASGQSTGGYTIAKSLRFRNSASAYLSRTPGSTGSQTTWTWSAWVKRGKLTSSTENTLFTAYSSISDRVFFGFPSNLDTLQVYSPNGGTINLLTSAIFRDPAAWYHVVLKLDTTQATSTNRLIIYINGVVQTLSGTFPAQNTTWRVNSTANHFIGQNGNSDGYFDGYMSDAYFIDGQALTPSSFGETDSITGVWKPKAFSGTYGTNGFYLPFTDVATTSGSNAGLGKDFSGNGNYWTTNNISVTAGATYDSMTDVPTLTSATVANYCVLNPLTAGSTISVFDGNLRITASGTYTSDIIRGSIGVSSGKWYWEATPVNSTFAGWVAGIVDVTLSGTNYSNLASNKSYAYGGDAGEKYNGQTGSAYGATYNAGDVIGVAFDATAGTLTFYKNNTSQGTAFTGISGTFTPLVLLNGVNSGQVNINFGQRPFTYTPPSGYVALNTYNLPTPTIAAGNKYMDATLYTGTLLSNSITNAGSFKPDLVWVKSRSAATDHKLTDSVRGVTKGLISNTQGVETTDTQGLTAINSNGFTVGTDTNYNNLTATYVAWQWQAGQGSTSSNTSGSITSTVSVNASAGFSIVTYTGNNTAGATIGHGLGVKPNLIIIKNKNVGTTNWLTYSSVLGATKFLKIESTDSAGTSILPFNNTEPTSSVFSVGAWDVPNGSGNSHIAYCWTEIAGFSKFGSYTGNNSTDGPFVYLGFRPKFLLIKSSSVSATSWLMLDSSRNTFNIVNSYLIADGSGAEGTYAGWDFLSNGFKIRNTAANGSGETVIYAAFAETPTKFANAR